MTESNDPEKISSFDNYLPDPGKTYRIILKWFSYGVIAFALCSVVSVLLLKWVNPPASSFMIQREFSAWWNAEENFELKYRWVDWEEISPYIKVAVITSEDQLFPCHWGFDLQSIQDAINENQQRDRLRGASTITQQVAKNLFLWPGRSFIRKGLEAWFTLWIELFWDKARILEIYLNIVEFGDGIYGVHAAAGVFFGMTPDRIDMLESALLVTVLPNPKRFDVRNPSPYMIERRNWVLRYMFYLGNTEYLKNLERDGK